MILEPTQPSRRALLLGLLTSVTAAACGGSSDTAPTSVEQTWVANVPFTITDVTAGTGVEAVNGARLIVDYYGWLYNATGTDKNPYMIKGQKPSKGAVRVGLIYIVTMVATLATLFCTTDAWWTASGSHSCRPRM